MDLNVWLILTLICTASGTTPWRTGPPDKTDNSLSTIPETTADQTELVPFTAIVTDDTPPYSKVTTPSYGTEAHTSPQTTDNSLSTIPETTADQTELVTDKDDTTPYSKVTTPSYGTGAQTSPHTPVTTPSYLTEFDTSTYTHTSVVTDSDDTTPYSKVTTPSYGTEAPISPQTPVTTPSYGTEAPISPQTPAWPPLTTQQPAQDENVTLVIGEMQTIMSPNYPSNYPNDALYNWYITATSGYDVLIHFLDFNTESCCDYLKIGTGDSPSSPGSVEVVSLSGSSLPSDIRLNSLTFWMHFTSDYSVTMRGFELQLRITNLTNENVTLVFGETQTIMSTNYPSNYPNDALYNWYITATSGYAVLIHFLDFRTEYCCDFLKIGTGDSPTSPGSVEVVSLSGSSLPSDIRLYMLYNPKCWMQFTSNDDITYQGFELQLIITNSTSDENVTLVFGETQTIMSTNYPSNYPNNALYNWYITAISGYDVLIHFLDFNLQSNNDFLRIGTGDSPNSPGSVEVVSLSGSSLPSDIRLFMLYKPTCWMQFTSNYIYTYQGFQLQLSIINSTSDEMIWLNIEDTENISSPNYPLNYDDNTEYNWYIAAPPGYDMLVHFLDFYIQANYDYLLIGSGDSAASPGSIKLYSLTAYSLPSDRRIYGPTGWITFTSNTGTNYRGFELQLTLINSTLGGYCEECCECGDVIGCNCDSACQSRDDCCYDYTPHCSQVRLVQSRDSGYNYASGSVEVFANGIWGTVCDHEWDLKDGHVVCRSMGFKRAFGVFYNAYFGQGTGNIHLDNVNCTGREPSIQNCSHDGLGVHDCTHADDAGVGCSTYSAGYCQGCCDCGFIESGTCFCDVSCQEFDDCCLDYESFCSEVHLRNGSTYIEGRVEVFADGVWGTVCDDFWDVNDAKVVCKSMGFPGVEGAFSGAAFGEGTGNITLDNVNCTGEESRILSCPNNGIGVHDCSHADDAGVRCSLTNDENVALIYGKTELLTSPNYPDNYYDNTVYNWLITAPSGFHVLIRVLYISLPICRDLVTIGTGDSPTSSDSVQLASLSGYEESSDIRLYTPTGWIQFTSDESGISDGFRLQLSSVDSTEAPARLVNGSYPNEGRVEVYSNSLDTWGTICDYGWDTMDATVICRSMGYPDAVRSYGSALYGMGSGPILLRNVDCDGDEDNVFYCPYESLDVDNCTHFEDAGAMCYPNVRLVNGSSPSEGRVEVYHDGIWGTACDSYWGSPESLVLCRSLGFPDALDSLPNAYFGEGLVSSLLRVSYCNGDENSIFDCCHYGIGYGCGHEDDVGVRCQSNVRLVNGGSSNEGRVEVYHGDTWGTVCDNGWGMDEARVICRSLGYPDVLQAFGNASFGQGTGDILLDEVDCIGNESSIFYCYHNGVGVATCSHQDDAGVRCSTGVTTPSYLTEFDTSTYTQTSVTTPSYGTEAPISPQTPAWPPLTTKQPVQGENVTLVVGETQNITSPNYPSNYTNNAYYNWYITAPPGYYVLIHFLDFNTESCCDYLKVGTGDSPTSYNSVQLASLSGSSLPSDIRLMTPTSWMKFTSNSNITDKGFQLEMSVYEAIEDETTAWTSITSLFYTVTSDPETTRDLEDMTTASTTTNIPTTSESSIPLPIIGAVTIVSLLVIVIIIVICVCLVCRKRRQRHMEEGLLDDDVFQPDYIELSPTPKTKKKNVIHKNRVSRPVLLANIETHYDWLKADSEHRLMEEYDDIQAVGSIVRMDQATNAEVNKTKNRFNKILPYEHSRVKLMALKGKSETDYINANYIPGFNSPREYIACQGPLPETTNDMWRMIWEKKSTIIVMMTKTVEGGKDKCHQYWPKKKGRSDTYGGSLEVSLQSELDYEHWITRTFMLQKNKMKREVIQLQFTSWPDHGVPEQTKPMLDFVKNVRERIRNKCVIKPVIVHCSAGVGRTGTYIALDRLTQHMEDNDFVDVCGVVCEMRMHRNYLVQTETQYIFIHDCLMDYFCSGVAP